MADENEEQREHAFFEYDGTTRKTRYHENVHKTEDGYRVLNFTDPPVIWNGTYAEVFLYSQRVSDSDDAEIKKNMTRESKWYRRLWAWVRKLVGR